MPRSFCSSIFFLAHKHHCFKLKGCCWGTNCHCFHPKHHSFLAMPRKNKAMHVQGKTTTYNLKTITICFTAMSGRSETMSKRLKTIIICYEAIVFQT
jgi:hypothetical protein